MNVGIRCGFKLCETEKEGMEINNIKYDKLTFEIVKNV